jgi:uncharacterized delta-60 repeat protein
MFATTLALTLGSLAVPAAALADGLIDPNFNGTGYHVGTVAEGTVFKPADNRVPTVIEPTGKIVIGGSSLDGAMTLVRYNLDGSLDTSFGSGGFAKRQFAGTPTSGPGNSGATAMTQVANGDILVAGFGASQSEIVARFSSDGAFLASTVCFAPHLIDYQARALAVRPNGAVVVVGFARDRHANDADPLHLAPFVFYGQRAVVTVPATGSGSCGTFTDGQGSAGVTIDGLSHDGLTANAALAGRQYDGVTAMPGTDNRYTLVSTLGSVDNAGWVQRYSAAGVGTLDPAFNLAFSGISFHAIKSLADGSVLAAGDTPGGALASDRQMVVAKIAGNGTMAQFGTGGIARTTVGSGDNTTQAIVVQPDNRVLVGGAAIVANRAGFGIARLTATGDIDGTFGSGGQTTTAIPDGAAYVTGMALNGNVLGVSGRAQLADGTIASIAARYYAIGDPPPLPTPPPPPGGGTAAGGTTTAGGATTGAAPKGAGGITPTSTKSKKIVKLCIVPKVTGKTLNTARKTVLAKGCSVKVIYKKSHKKKGTVLLINRKVGKKLVFRALVKITIAKPF